MSHYFCRDIQMVVRILCKQHESMNPACLLSTVQSAGDGVGDIVLAQFAPLSTSWPWFNQHSLPQYCSHFNLFTITVYSSSDNCFQQDNAPSQKEQITSN